MTTFFLFAFLPTVFLLITLWKRNQKLQREAYIRQFSFPRGVFDKVIAKHPQLTQKEMELVSHGLRQFFLAYQKSGYQFVSMPSQIADDLWHEFILYTQHYQDFCRRAFGRFLHHTPAIVLQKNQQGNAGLRRCWRYVCKEENINPHIPSRLPLLFALDTKLNIPNGFRYVPDCSGVRREDAYGNGAVYCGGSFSDSSIDGGSDGFSDSGQSDGGSDGGSDGCGGGCGGGGD
jgi:hypothetical protein